MWRKQMNFTVCGQGRRGGERLFIESYLNRLDGQESEGFASSQAEPEGWIFLKD